MKTAHLLSRKCAVGVLLILTSENRASDQINLREVRLERVSEADVDVGGLFFVVALLGFQILVERSFSIAAADIELGTFARHPS